MKWIESLPVKISRGEYIKPLTPEWYNARRGRLTASKRAMTIFKENPKSWAKMEEEIRFEMSDAWQLREISAPALDWGRELEPEAIKAVSYALQEEVIDPGFILHQQYDFVGSTPDGFAGDATIQIKCPYNAKNHLETLTTLKINEQYFYQCQWEMWTSGKRECIFASYDPRQPVNARLALISIDIDDNICETFDRNTLKFARIIEGQLGPNICAEPRQSGVATNLF